MKVKHFLSSLNPKFGGPTASVPVQCIGLSNLGVDVTLVTMSESRPYEGKLLEAGVKIEEYNSPRTKLGKLLSVPIMNYLKNDDDTDIYHYHGIWKLGCNWIPKSAHKKGKKYIVNPRGDLELYRINYNKWKKIKKMLAWHLYAKSNTDKASCVLTTSRQEADAVRHLGITAPIAIIPNGMDLSIFPKKIIHTPHEKKIVLFLSRVNPIKGLELLIEAWHNLPISISKDWELHIAGNSDPSDYINKLTKLVTDLGLENSVKFLGPIKGEAKMRKYQDSDLFILPTFNENFGNVVAESMMCECPVITTTNAPWSCLQEDNCGWWIDLSVSNLIDTLIEAMSLSDGERHQLGLKGRQCIINRFSSESVARKTQDLYKWVLNMSDKPNFVEIIN